MFRKIPVQFSSLENKTLISLQKKKNRENTNGRRKKERDRERVEKTGWIKSKAAFRCLHASRLNEDQSRVRSSKQDD